MSTPKRSPLGRGLDVLISMDDMATAGSSSINEIPLSRIEANPDQPRRDFDPIALQELSDSIRKVGLVQPITLREMPSGKLQIIAGERRYRASLLAGLTTIPAYVRTAQDETVMEMALIENIQREDLNAIEIALTFEKLIQQYSLTQERLSERVGKNRTTVTNYLRLLKLPAEVQLGLTQKAIDMGHARALLSIPSPTRQLEVYEMIIAQGLSVRRVEEIVKEILAGALPASGTAKKKESPRNFNLLSKHLSGYLQTPVQLSCNPHGKGKIVISFTDDAELERIIALLDTIDR